MPVHSPVVSIPASGILAALCMLLPANSAQPPLNAQAFVPTETASLLGTPDPELPPYRAQRAFPALSFVRPVLVTHAGDGTDRLFVASQRGEIFAFANRDEISEATLWLDIRDRVSRKGNEEGLLGLAFHPRFSENGEFFVYYSTQPRASVISRFRVSAEDPNRALRDSEEILLRVPQPHGNHNGGSIAFGPDGKLYIGLGDGGSKNDPYEHGQNLETLLGSILRIDVDRADEGKAYGIPPDNPFVHRGAPVRGEIWAFGLRNVWRISFDRETGTCWVGDVGQRNWEEIDIIVKGGNYGWNVREGKHWFRRDGRRENEDFIEPVWEYRHDLGESITGGLVYRGKKLPGLHGAYIYADYKSTTLWALRHGDGKETTNHRIARSRLQVSSFGDDEAGELLFTAFDGNVYRLAQAPNPEHPSAASQAEFPRRLSDTKLFVARGDNLVPAPSLLPYSVNVPLWSDGAKKERYLALPENGKVEATARGGWKFPVGTVAVKTFALPGIAGSGAERKLETRLLVLSDRGWDGYTYKWNDEQTEAILLGEVSLTESYSVSDIDGEREVEWYYPSRADCHGCHTASAGFVLGLRTNQLNRVHPFLSGSAHQLDVLDRLGIFSQPLPRPLSALPAFPNWDDPSAPTEALARAYLDVNCAACHVPGGTGNAKFDLRHHVPLEDTLLVNAPPELPRAGGPRTKLLVPGRPGESEVLLRMLQTGPERMPAMATERVDWKAVGVVGNWIQNLAAPPPANLAPAPREK